jgi:hypothetical protein
MSRHQSGRTKSLRSGFPFRRTSRTHRARARGITFSQQPLSKAKKNFWSDVGEDPEIDPALAAAIDRTLSLLPRHGPEKIDATT